EGIKQASARTVQFGGTDSALSAQTLNEKGLVQIPMLVGGLVPVVNLPGVGANKMVLTGEVLAEIMLGRVTHWDDERVALLNPGLSLPHKPIVRVARTDASGTSEAFARYLSMSSAVFRGAVTVSQKPNWPGTVVTADGMDGLARVLKATPGAISYLSYDRVIRDELTAVRLRNPKGQEVAASEDGFREAILGSNVYLQGDDTASLLNVARRDAWPITVTSYVLLDARPKDKKVSDWTAHYVYWCFMHGDELTRGTGFAPLPAKVQAKLVARLLQIHGPDGDVPKFIQP
ncbi:MAG TPA: phosphate ABC transporter substrate-binding protein PstS, partial [Aquabacterium sp.]|nr:phosphate ABC transporter substrate-binding protein PstS [Aquabacterium sp.]